MIVADYTAMCALLDLLDFDAFCAGYLDHGRWRSLREKGLSVDDGVTSGREESRGRASYAS